MVCFGFCQVGGMPILSVCKSYLDYLFEGAERSIWFFIK